MPNSGFSQSLKCMENVLNKDSSNYVKFEKILCEELREYFQYISNPCDEKMIALSAIAGKDIFGRYYEVQKRARKFDFAEALPLMYEANCGDKN